jgi:hypothetical protein
MSVAKPLRAAADVAHNLHLSFDPFGAASDHPSLADGPDD